MNVDCVALQENPIVLQNQKDIHGNPIALQNQKAIHRKLAVWVKKWVKKL